MSVVVRCAVMLFLVALASPNAASAQPGGRFHGGGGGRAAIPHGAPHFSAPRMSAPRIGGAYGAPRFGVPHFGGLRPAPRRLPPQLVNPNSR